MPRDMQDIQLDLINERISSLRERRNAHLDESWKAARENDRRAWQFHVDRFTELVNDIHGLRRLLKDIREAPPYA